MKKLIYLLVINLGLYVSSVAQAPLYSDYFEDATLRMDYHHSGNNISEKVYLNQYKKEGPWAGNKSSLITPFDFGKYRVMVYDAKSSVLLFSNGYSSLFMEWQSTEEAQIRDKSFYESVLMPYPKNKVRIELQSIDSKLRWTTIFSETLDPENYFIAQDPMPNYKVVNIHGKAKLSKALDIVFLPEGYTASEMDKFVSDVKRMKDYLFKVKPFNLYSDKINITAVLAPSQQSETDVPGQGIWKNTVLNSNFYTFDSERYLTTSDVKSIRDIAALSSYDQIYILVNTDKYGGGGIYNFYNLCVSDNAYTEEVFTHEFGHGLGWLADEYFYDDEMSDFYDKSQEPREANITTLVNFESKWKHKLAKNTPIPTLKRDSKIGVYEGGGYSSKGIYRPFYDCKMKSNSTNEFCEVCAETLVKILDFYTK